jgi:OOP family OmpA-OmpF porin
MKKRSAISTFSAVAVVVAAMAPAAPAISGCAYTVSAGGANVRDSQGNCVRTSTWSKDQWTEACGKPKPKPAPKPAPKPEPVAEPEPAPMPPPPAPAPVQEKITLSSVSGQANFAVNSAKLTDAGRSAIDEVVEQLRGFDRVKSIVITGHTDSTGSAAYNQKLSERRAAAVRDYLISRGVNPALLTSIGAGEDQPIADNSTKEGRQMNRRVEIDIEGVKTVVQ